MLETYEILRAAEISMLPELEAALLASRPEWSIALKRYFLSDRSQKEQLPSEDGAVSWIVQPPLDDKGAGVFLYLVKGATVTKTGHTTIVTDGDTKHFWTAGLTSEADGPDSQTTEILTSYESFLEEQGMTLEANCIRTWIFVDDIDHNYSGMVKARRENFLTQGLTPQTHYIASTGIFGTPVPPKATVQVDAYAVKGSFSQKYLYALSHLNRTIEYGVTFERGTVIEYSGMHHLLISGTASIDNKGQVLHKGDIMAQADRMFENIEALLEEGGSKLSDIKMAITYLRNREDAQIVRPYVDSRLGDIPHIMVLAPVCRPDWLIETECIAQCRPGRKATEQQEEQRRTK